MQNLTHLDNVFGRLANFEFNIAYNEAQTAASEGVNLIYRNRELCSFDKIYNDVTAWCSTDAESCLLEDIFANIQKNVFPVAMRLEQLWELLIKDDVDTDAEIFAMADSLGES